ncbi:hypothetical protein [Streptomyces sp. R08]|uniref:Uncharacterized protein n=1 Tax=Streptomyces sp. R08 TaxID=3238624 RepID=A0AB39M8A5_9ACTN
MSTASSVSTAPVVLLSGLEPVAVEGCDVCGALVVQREAARKVANAAKVKNLSDEIARHPHADAPDTGAQE